MYDYHQNQFPLPTIIVMDSDEVLYYVDGDFMSRNNIEQGHITLHPKGFRTVLHLERWKEVGHKETRVGRNG
jgi:homogentisate 1,2-dioxygenase